MNDKSAVALRAIKNAIAQASGPAPLGFVRPKGFLKTSWEDTLKQLVSGGFVHIESGKVGLTAAGEQAAATGIIKESGSNAKEIECGERLRARMLAMDKLARNHTPYLTRFGFLAKWGLSFPISPRRLPGTPKFCFSNAHGNANRTLGRNWPLLYAEGIAEFNGVPIEIDHAWNVERNEKGAAAVEATDAVIPLGYLGVVFREPWRRTQYRLSRKHDVISLIDNWPMKWPLLRMPEDEVRAILYHPADLPGTFRPEENSGNLS